MRHQIFSLDLLLGHFVQLLLRVNASVKQVGSVLAIQMSVLSVEVELPSVEEPLHLGLEWLLLDCDEVQPVVDDLPHLRVELPPLDHNRKQLAVIWNLIHMGLPVTDSSAQLVQVALLSKLFALVNLLLSVPLLAHELNRILDVKTSFQNLFDDRAALVDVLDGCFSVSLILPFLKCAPKLPAHDVVDHRDAFARALFVRVALDSHLGKVPSHPADVQLVDNREGISGSNLLALSIHVVLRQFEILNHLESRLQTEIVVLLGHVRQPKN